MKNIKINIKMNKTKINKIKKASEKSLKETAEETLSELKKQQKMPFDSGSMQNENTFIDFSKSKNGKIKIITNTPQARRLYFHPEYNFQKVNNQNAGGMWWNDFINGKNKDFSKKIFMKFYKKEGGI